ncbi:hypothetical protein IW261DRAFT_1559897 [Armillaria novae-zelandiae]|uniref:DUF6535 domain-containing protein n=1 Tax=Armillaria novae-zelandiae TaxID=153914 RepID=A0AA39PMW7_9AGAR|nr:hypothetical protein IW261DRAFT_1559897 [Armillaria novae-zelandiae]
MWGLYLWVTYAISSIAISPIHHSPRQGTYNAEWATQYEEEEEVYWLEIHPLLVNASHAKFQFGMKKQRFRQGTICLTTRTVALKSQFTMKQCRMPGYGGLTQTFLIQIWWRILASRDNVDILLVSAGSFSATVSISVTEASQSLSADYTQMVASLLFELVAIQRALAGSAAVDTVNVSPHDHSSIFVPSTKCIRLSSWYLSSNGPKCFPEAVWSLPGLKELVSGVGPIDEYGPVNLLHLICSILGFGLREDVKATYDAFLDMHCLELFSRVPFHPHFIWSGLLSDM